MLGRFAKAPRRVKQLFRKAGEPFDGLQNEVVAQKQLMLAYQQLPSEVRLPFRQVGFSLYSQHDEDGILLYIFSRIGSHSFKAVEMCAGTGYECNVANLLINHRWTGLLVDGNPANIAKARDFYMRRPETTHWPPTILEAWITRDNVNDILINAGFVGDIDLLSLDVDGVDYWLWEAMTAVSPRVVVLEYNHLHGPISSVTVPYRADFVAEFTQYGSDYAGASLAAFIGLGRRKGYRYVGSNTIGTNAFFIREDVSAAVLPEASPEDAFTHPRARFGMEVRYPKIKDKEWQKV